MRENWKGNPLNTWLDDHRMTPCQLAIAAGLDYNIPYMVLNCYSKQVPHKILEAVDQIDGDGAGDKLSKAYEVYRDGMAHDLLTA